LSNVIFSTSEEGFPLAVRELREEFGRRLPVERLGPDVGTAAGLSVAEVAERCRRRPIVFVKHLTSEVARLDPGAALSTIAAAAVENMPPVPTVAVQAWVSGRGPERGLRRPSPPIEHSGRGPERGLRRPSPPIEHSGRSSQRSSAEVAAAITEAVRGVGLVPARAGQDFVISCCITEHAVLIGHNRAEWSIADWPGGRVRLAKAPDQVSRAEFKLEELLIAGELALPDRGTALDLGAAPGGWTRILRRAGLDVVAVDPGDLDPRLAGDPGVRHVRTTAHEFLRSSRQRFDVAVNDLRMDATLSSRLMVDAAAHLREGAPAVLTLKCGTNRVLELVERCLSVLRTRYELQLVRQLQHNRHEITAVLRHSR
jgi:23S rRNA (cytidine2498-2'-O)-methyltransferase